VCRSARVCCSPTCTGCLAGWLACRYGAVKAKLDAAEQGGVVAMGLLDSGRRLMGQLLVQSVKEALEAALKPHGDWPVAQRISVLREALSKAEACFGPYVAAGGAGDLGAGMLCAAASASPRHESSGSGSGASTPLEGVSGSASQARLSGSSVGGALAAAVLEPLPEVLLVADKGVVAVVSSRSRSRSCSCSCSCPCVP
jgi:hypothetical protein